MVTRYAIGVAFGVVVTFTLFLLMQALIKSDKSPFDEGAKGRIVDGRWLHTGGASSVLRE